MATTRPVEVELKYLVMDVAVAERLLDGDGLPDCVATGPTRTNQVEDRYVDTADHALARAGFAARLRHGATGTLVTLKSLSSTRQGALHRREEIEGIADLGFPPLDWPASPARSMVLELAGDAPLVELVTVRQLRRVRPFRTGETEIEVSLDQVDVVTHGSIVQHLTELEAELRGGPVEGLARLGDRLAGITGLVPATGSKLELALAAAGITIDASSGDEDVAPAGAGGETAMSTARETTMAIDGGATEGSVPEGRAPAAPAREADRASSPETEPASSPETEQASSPETAPAPDAVPSEAASPQPEPGPAGPGTATAEPREPEAPERLAVGRTPGVRADDTLAEAGRKVLRFHLARMLAREAGTRSGKDPEDLHAMRVATRRMRAAWRVFGDAYRPRRERRYVRDLREVAARLGAVRDLDVLIDDLLRYVGRQPALEQPHLAPLVDAWRRQREDARALLVRTLDSDGYRRFVDEYREFVQTDGLAVLPVAPAQPHRVRDRMPTRIWEAFEQVRAYEPILRWADVETLHALRISVKRLRYTIEFVREPLGAEATALIDRVVALQDHLGYLHDADVAAGLARQFLVDHSADLSEPETAAIGRFLVDRERELARLRRGVGGPWRPVAGLAFRRALGRVVAGL